MLVLLAGRGLKLKGFSGQDQWRTWPVLSTGWHSLTTVRPGVEPLAITPDIAMGRQACRRFDMTHWQQHWHDHMADQPDPGDGAYLTGWTISGLAVLGTIVAVWLLGV
jgi:hypothetical protein